MRRVLLPLLFGGCALASSAGVAAEIVAGGDTPAVTPRPAAAPPTPVLSLRRAPEALATAVGQARLTHRLDQTLADPAFRGATTCLTVETGDDLIYARNPEESLLPASTMKVLTGMAALREMGSDFRFVTPLVAPGGAPSAGVVDGPAWLVGSGDPLLSTTAYAASFRNQPQVFTSLDALADATVAAGIREIRGGVVGDESRYDSQRYLPSWKDVYLTDNDVGPVSALTVNDGFTQFRPLPRRHAPDPALHAAATLTALLRARGVLVGEPATGKAPAGVAVLAEATSPPLSDIVGELLRESDNMTAELLVKEMGARGGGAGSWPAGLDVLRETLEEARLPTTGFHGVDGSGLDVGNRLTCALLMDALDLAGGGGEVAAGFPVAGRTGTLADRFRGNPAEGRLRAKTGSLNHVAGLAGFVDTPGTTDLEFALLANGLPDRVDSGRALQERVGAALSTYPEVPATDVLGPAP